MYNILTNFCYFDAAKAHDYEFCKKKLEPIINDFNIRSMNLMKTVFLQIVVHEKINHYIH